MLKTTEKVDNTHTMIQSPSKDTNESRKLPARSEAQVRHAPRISSLIQHGEDLTCIARACRVNHAARF
jgi:hypothetical protein